MSNEVRVNAQLGLQIATIVAALASAYFGATTKLANAELRTYIAERYITIGEARGAHQELRSSITAQGRR